MSDAFDLPGHYNSWGRKAGVYVSPALRPAYNILHITIQTFYRGTLFDSRNMYVKELRYSVDAQVNMSSALYLLIIQIII